jgi:hypothetical protein
MKAYAILSVETYVELAFPVHARHNRTDILYYINASTPPIYAHPYFYYALSRRKVVACFLHPDVCLSFPVRSFLFVIYFIITMYWNYILFYATLCCRSNLIHG